MYIKRYIIKLVRSRITAILAAVSLLMVSGNFMSCEPEDWMLVVDCADCYGYLPDSADLIIYLTIDAENDSVPLTFYRGNYEDGIIDWQDTATTEEFYLYSEVDREYSVSATYKSGNQTIIAFDGDKMFLYDAGEECGSPCHIIKGGILDLRLLK
ncbi:MAG: hypothetical protein KAR16_00720 [Bacteroidales bacterium]|nr:hypothetical protein [Bacteroidales bacterium]